MNSIIFFGSDQYAALVLSQLIRTGDQRVSSVITTPRKPVGRTKELTPNPVEIEAMKHDLKVSYYPDNREELNTFIESLNVTPQTVGLSASFPRILPPSLIAAFAGQLYNIHPSLLPQYRNVAPVPYAIAMGDKITGVTIFRIGEGIDNGEIVAQISEPILESDTTPMLLQKLFIKGTELCINWLSDPLTHRPPDLPTHLPLAPLIFTRRLTRESAYIEWPILLHLLKKEPISVQDTANPLIRERLTHHPDRTDDILRDLCRALEGYEKVWTTADTRKGALMVSMTYQSTHAEYGVLIAGKPKSIPWQVFRDNYL